MIWFLISNVASAQEHGEEIAHEVGHELMAIPWGNIGVQAYNFAILFGLLAWFLRKPIKAHFAQRAQSFQELVDRAENARLEAEKIRAEALERLAKLESSAANNVAQARSEAAELHARLMSEAKSLSLKLEQEAKAAATIELEKAKTELRHELLVNALNSSETKLKQGIGSVEQKKLQTEFVDKIGVVTG